MSDRLHQGVGGSKRGWHHKALGSMTYTHSFSALTHITASAFLVLGKTLPKWIMKLWNRCVQPYTQNGVTRKIPHQSSVRVYCSTKSTRQVKSKWLPGFLKYTVTYQPDFMSVRSFRRKSITSIYDHKRGSYRDPVHMNWLRAPKSSVYSNNKNNLLPWWWLP